MARKSGRVYLNENICPGHLISRTRYVSLYMLFGFLVSILLKIQNVFIHVALTFQEQETTSIFSLDRHHEPNKKRIVTGIKIQHLHA